MAKPKGPVGGYKVEADNSDLPMPSLPGSTKARQPSDEELKEWSEKAGVAPETVGEQRSSRQKSESFVSAAANVDDVAETRGADEGAITGGIDPSDLRRKKRAYKPAAFRMAYAKHVAGETASPEALEAHAKEWDGMSETAQHDWQNNEGAEALEKFKANEGPQSAHAASEQRSAFREKIRNAAFPSPEARQAFEQRGELKRDAIVHDIPNIKDPVQRAALGEPSTLPESDWRRVFQAHLTSNPKVGLVPQAAAEGREHFEKLSAHIDDLDSRKPYGTPPVMDLQGRPMRTTSVKIAPNNLQGAFFGDSYRIGAPHSVVIQPNQFHPADQKIQGARESLAKAAKAHTLGLTDLALTHFRKAVDLTGDVADLQHRGDKARGADNGEAPVADWDKGDKILSDYRKHLESWR